MLVVVSYDISEDKKRNRLAKLLLGYGTRIQYSVFECDLTHKRFMEMYERIAEIVVEIPESSVRMYSLCENCRDKTLTIGTPLSDLERLSQNVIVI